MKIAHSKISGRGVFASQAYKPGDTIEVCPIIRLTEADRRAIDSTSLYSYYYSWGEDSSEAAIALGYGSLYNHSYNPNAQYTKDLNQESLVISAIQDIHLDDEILINYNGDPTNTAALWFDVHE